MQNNAGGRLHRTFKLRDGFEGVNVGCMQETPGVEGRGEVEAVSRIEACGQIARHGMAGMDQTD